MLNGLRVLLFLVSLHFFTVLLPGLALGATPDQPGTVKGVVQSADAETALPGANVAVHRASDSTLVDGTTTDSTGHFVVDNLATGRYMVKVSFVGYTPQSRTVTLTANQSTRRLDPFRLAATAAQMEEATVSAERSFVTTKGSKTIYNVEKSQVAVAGKSSVDVLRDLPSIRIDAFDRAIRLRGNQSVSVHVNGEPVSMSGKALVQYLKGLSADDIERVEVNTNPSARHDAEGTAGIVNIVLDRADDRGLSGGVSASAGVGPRVNGSGNLGYQQGAWTLYGSYSYRHREGELVQDLRRRRAGGAAALLLEQSSVRQFGYGGHTFDADIEYALTPTTTLSLVSTGNIRGNDHRLKSTVQQGSADSTRVRKTKTNRQSVHLDERLSVTHTFEEKNHELSADLRYQRGDDYDRVREKRVPTVPEREETTEEEHDASVKIDYVRPQDEWTIETGYKGALRHLDHSYQVAHPNTDPGDIVGPPTQSEALTFREQVHAGYGILQRTVGPLDAEVGLRVEHTRTTIDPGGSSASDNRYTNLFPSASLTYPMGPERRVSLSYSKRIDRPSAHQLSAFDASSDPYVRFVGTPNLKPEHIHKAELTVMQTVGPATITVTPYARRKTDAIEWATVQADSVTIRTYDNYDARTSYGAELTSSLQLESVKANLSGNLYRRSTRGGLLPDGKTRNAFAVMGRTSVTWTPLDGLRLQASQMYRSPVTTGLGRLDPFMRTSASLERTFWDEKGTLGVQIEDPFNTSEIGLQKRTDAFRERLTRDWDGRTVSLSFSYRFGDSSQKKRRRSSSSGGGLGMGGG